MLEKPVVRIGLYWVLACLWSWPFMIWSVQYPESWNAIPVPGFFKTSLMMWGPGLSAIILYLICREQGLRKISLAGNRPASSAAFFLVPLLVMGLVAIPLAGVSKVLLMVSLFGVVGYFNTLGEELGWRGFLQDATSGINLIPRFFLVGLLWELWHLPIRYLLWQHIGWSALIFSLLSFVFAFILGLSVRRSHALTVAVTLHFWINGVREIPRMLGIDPLYVYAVAAISVIYWAWLLFRWRAGGTAGSAAD